MSDLLLPNNWWEKSAFGPFTAPQDLNDGGEDLDGDLELFLAIEELLTGKRKLYWEHERLVQLAIKSNCFLSLSNFDCFLAAARAALMLAEPSPSIVTMEGNNLD